MSILPDLLIIDNALSAEELAKWQIRTLMLVEQSTGCSAEEMVGEALLARAREIVGDLELIHAPQFAIVEGMDTEMHQDVGEYVVVYYPFDCPTAPLGFAGKEHEDVAVVANRLVAFDATLLTHQQLLPSDGSTRYSIALKFRREVF